MAAYVARKLFTMPLLLLAVSIIVFTMVNLIPGDPVSFLISPELPSKVADARREALGLDQPVLVRYFLWLKEILRGNLGYSYLDYQPVSSKIIERLGRTLLLMSAGLLFALLVGTPLGILSATKRYSFLDYSLTIGAFTAVSVPHFFLGLVFIFVLGLKLKLLPVGGMYKLGTEPTVQDIARHLIMPALVLALEHLAIYMRLARGSLLEVLGTDYIRTAYAKGLSQRVVLYRHALRNSLQPILTRLGLSLAWLFSGAVITEQVFQWPGIGMLTIDALGYRDYPVLMGINLVAASLVIVGNLLADVLYAIADPRVRFQ
jgi:peptide/nickel transport system permease protein